MLNLCGQCIVWLGLYIGLECNCQIKLQLTTCYISVIYKAPMFMMLQNQRRNSLKHYCHILGYTICYPIHWARLYNLPHSVKYRVAHTVILYDLCVNMVYVYIITLLSNGKLIKHTYCVLPAMYTYMYWTYVDINRSRLLYEEHNTWWQALLYRSYMINDIWDMYMHRKDISTGSDTT